MWDLWQKDTIMYSRKLNYGYEHRDRQTLEAIVNAYGQMIFNYMHDGWDAYMLSVLFDQLAGSRKAQIAQMNREIDRMYNRLATRMVRKPESPSWAGYLPIGFFVPDLPVPKNRVDQKSTIEDVSINNGLHMGGIVLANRWARIRCSLVKHFKEERDRYAIGKIRSVEIEQITKGLETTTRYTFKSLTRYSFTPDDVLVLNWGEKASFRPCAAMELFRERFERDLKKTPPSRAACYKMWNKMKVGDRAAQLRKIDHV